MKVARCLLVTVGLNVAVLASAVPAQADDAAAARFHDQRAREHYRRGRYEEAIREFFIEQRIAPNPRVVFNIALCFRLLGEDAEAFQMYTEYLASDDADEVRRTQAQTAVEALSPQVARLTVTTDPPGARIYVDQEEHGAYGHSPAVIAVEPGDHRVFVELARHRHAETTISAERGAEVVVSLTLEAITGTLRITASEAGVAQVRTPGGDLVAEGATPLTARLPPGPYEVSVSKAGFQSNRGLVEVRTDVTTQHEAVLVALPTAIGTLTVTANHTGALVTVDGTPAGFTPLVLEDLRVGEHALLVERQGLDPWRGHVEIHDEAPTWVTLALEDEDVRTVHSPATWILGGTGLATLTAGGVVGLFALQNHAEFEDARAAGRSDVGNLRDDGVVLNAVADVLFGVGAAALLAGVVLFVMEELDEPRQSRASISHGENVSETAR